MRRFICLTAMFLVSACDNKPTDNTMGGCNASNATSTSSISIQGTAYVPNCFKVTRGTQVSFTNQDAVRHTVTTDNGQPETFDSTDILQGQAYRHTFGVPGTINGHCTYHTSMHFTAVVQ